jgi:hypothetical protein
VFKTNDISWHGLPTQIQCPADQFRKSLAFYFASPLNSKKTEKEYRKKAKYILTDEKDKRNPLLQQLCEIRANRRISEEDRQQYFPNWDKTQY